MNRKQLMYFMEAYRTCNIQAAADVLYISHQGLSRVLRTLEEELGQPLFRRSNRGLEPTGQGDGRTRSRAKSSAIAVSAFSPPERAFMF